MYSLKVNGQIYQLYSLINIANIMIKYVNLQKKVLNAKNAEVKIIKNVKL